MSGWADELLPPYLALLGALAIYAGGVGGIYWLSGLAFRRRFKRETAPTDLERRAAERVLARSGHLVADGWAFYAEHYIPSSLSAPAIEHLRLAYYSGAHEIAMKLLDTSLAPTSSLPRRVLFDTGEELRLYWQSILPEAEHHEVTDRSGDGRARD